MGRSVLILIVLLVQNTKIRTGGALPVNDMQNAYMHLDIMTALREKGSDMCMESDRLQFIIRFDFPVLQNCFFGMQFLCKA